MKQNLKRKDKKYIRLELGIDEIKKMTWFGHVMQMREEKIPKKMLHKKGGKTTKRKTQNQMDQIRNNMGREGKIGRKYKKRRENDQEEDQNHMDEIRKDIEMGGLN